MKIVMRQSCDLKRRRLLPGSCKNGKSLEWCMYCGVLYFIFYHSVNAINRHVGMTGEKEIYLYSFKNLQPCYESWTKTCDFCFAPDSNRKKGKLLILPLASTEFMYLFKIVATSLAPLFPVLSSQ